MTALVEDRGSDEWLRLQHALLSLDEPTGCTKDPELWWATWWRHVDRAKAVCEECPVLELCRAYALAADDAGGTLGGLSERERRELTERQAS